MVLTVSINGPDNAGKTTQISLLPVHWSIALIGSLHEYYQYLGDLVKANKLKDWWWSCPDEEFVSAIFTALASRQAYALRLQGKMVAFFDRGTLMFEAVATAVLAVKDPDHDLDRSRQSVQAILMNLDLQVEYEELAILLRQHRDLETAIKIGFSRETQPVDERYELYQRLLHREIDNQLQLHKYDFVCVEEGDESHRKIQDAIRLFVGSRTLPQVLKPILSTVCTIYAVGGLSERGKSTVASRIVEFYGSEAHRLKIGYLLGLVSNRIGKDVHECPEKDQAFALHQTLHEYSQAQ